MEGRWQPAPFGFVAQYMDEGRPLPEAMTDAVHEAKLFAEGTKQGYRRRIEPDWASIHRELKRNPQQATKYDELRLRTLS